MPPIEKDYSLDFINFPVHATYYSHHSWLLAAYSDFKASGITLQQAAEVDLTWDEYYEPLEKLFFTESKTSLLDCVSSMIETAPPSVDYIEQDIKSFRLLYSQTQDRIAELAANFSVDYLHLYKKDFVAWTKVFNTFYSSIWEDSHLFKAAVKSYCAGSYFDMTIHLWACMRPKNLVMVYTLSDYLDDFDHEHHWLAYDDANEYVCTSCGEKKQAITTY
jgi:hypothetical protein